MITNETKENTCFRESLPVRLSFREAFRRAADQVGLREYAEDGEEEYLRELCYIIAEVYLMDPNGAVRIGKEELGAYLVQEVFAELTVDHLRLVWTSFCEQTVLIRNKRAYLRTALYNSVFEFSASYANKVSHDMKGDRA